jgi:hypothetical protein
MATRIFQEYYGTKILLESCKNFNHLKKLGEQEMLYSLMKSIAPAHVSREMSLGIDKVMEDNGKSFLRLDDQSLMLDETIYLIGPKGDEIQRADFKSSLRRIKGLAVYANLVESVSYSSKKKGEYSFLIYQMPIEKCQYAYSTILASMLNNKSLEETKKIYRNKMHKTPFSETNPAGILLYNPTMKRVKEAAVEFRRFIDFAGSKKEILVDMAHLVMNADFIKEADFGHIHAATREFSELEYSRFMKKAEELRSKMNVPDFSKLENKVLKPFF